MHEDLRRRLLGRWAEAVTRHPWLVLIVAAVATAGSVLLSQWRLGFQSDRNDLIARDLPFNRRFIDWQASFPGTRDIYVAIDAGAARAGTDPASPAGAAARAAADELGEALRASGFADEAAGGVVWKFDTAEASPKAIRLEPMEAFRSHLAEMRDAKDLLASPTPAALLASAAAQMGGSATGDEAAAAAGLRSLTRFVAAAGEVLRRDAEPANPGADPGADFAARVEGSASAEPRWRYQTTENGRFVILRITPRGDAAELNALGPAIAGVRGVLGTVAARHPDLHLCLTGIEVVEADETDAAIRDASLASAVSFVLITAMLVISYHSWKAPLLAMAALLVGLAWSFGYTTLAVGHLQVISVIFATMLLGISDAYGVHLAANLELIRHEHPDTPEGFVAAMRRSFETMGPGIITGAVITAASFLTTVVTDFRGVAEMGHISGVGIALCLLAMLTVYPALLRVFKWRRRDVTPPAERAINFYSDRWVMPFIRRPAATLAVAGVVVAASAVAIARMHFDYDLLKLQPAGMESVECQRKIMVEGEQSIWSATSVAANLDEARERAARFRRLPTVSGVGGVGYLFPEDEPAKLDLIRDTRRDLAAGLASALEDDPATTRPAAASRDGDALAQLAAIRFRLGLASLVRLPAAMREALDDLGRQIDAVLAAEQGWTAEHRAARLAALDRAYAGWRQAVAERIDRALDPSPLALADLPAEAMRSYRAADGRVALEVFPNLAGAGLPPGAGVDSPLHPRFLPRFISDIRTVDPAATGVIVQVFESGSVIKRSYAIAGVLSLLVVFVFVWLDFRSLGFALLSLLPVAVGFAATFGAMWVFGYSLNPANIIVLPLMFGIGVDSGVHMLHRYRQDPVNRPLGLTSGTGKGITVTALTTIIGFTALMLARHRGIASLGFVLTVGLTLTLVACLTVMPAGLEAWERLRSRGGGSGVSEGVKPLTREG